MGESSKNIGKKSLFKKPEFYIGIVIGIVLFKIIMSVL